MQTERCWEIWHEGQEIERKIINNSSAECQWDPGSTTARLAWNNQRLLANSCARSQVKLMPLKSGCKLPFWPKTGTRTEFSNKEEAPRTSITVLLKRQRACDAESGEEPPHKQKYGWNHQLQPLRHGTAALPSSIGIGPQNHCDEQLDPNFAPKATPSPLVPEWESPFQRRLRGKGAEGWILPCPSSAARCNDIARAESQRTPSTDLTRPTQIKQQLPTSLFC